METRVEAGSPDAAVILVDRRTYGFDGFLKQADQEYKSGEGDSRWLLDKDAAGAWRLVATVGGVARPGDLARSFRKP